MRHRRLIVCFSTFIGSVANNLNLCLKVQPSKKGNKVSTSTRISAIMDILNQTKQVSASELSKTLSVSVETIRRDLGDLEKDGIVRRIRGGAVLIESAESEAVVESEPQVVETGVENPDAVKQIGAEAAKLIKSGMTVCMLNSEFNYWILKSVKPNTKLTIITNSVELLTKFKNRPNFKFICTGGDLDLDSMALYGPDAVTTLHHYNADLVFLTCDSVDMELGVMHREMHPSEMALVMSDQSDSRILLATNEQFDCVSVINTMHFRELNTIVTEQPLDDEWTKFLKNKGVDLVVPASSSTTTAKASTLANASTTANVTTTSNVTASTEESVDLEADSKFESATKTGAETEIETDSSTEAVTAQEEASQPDSSNLDSDSGIALGTSSGATSGTNLGAASTTALGAPSDTGLETAPDTAPDTAEVPATVIFNSKMM